MTSNAVKHITWKIMLKSDAPHPRSTWKNLLNFSNKSPAAQLLNTNSGVQHYNKTEE